MLHVWIHDHRRQDAVAYSKQPGESEVVHHVSTRNIANFKHLSHFGTHQAARTRAEHLENESFSRSGNLPTFHTYSARLKLGKIHDLKFDSHEHTPSSLLHQLGAADNKVFTPHEVVHHLKKMDTMPKASHAKYVAGEINKKGIDSLSYNNEHEDPGSKSYIVTQPHQVRVLKHSPDAYVNTERS